ncbi:MAG: hypothetical protein Q8907_10165 [Bacteroidota bacterium]|nr:hypothetical protein [Bacteroidota bacterium]
MAKAGKLFAAPNPLAEANGNDEDDALTFLIAKHKILQGNPFLFNLSLGYVIAL